MICIYILFHIYIYNITLCTTTEGAQTFYNYIPWCDVNFSDNKLRILFLY